MYYLKTNFDNDFADLLMHLKAKYGKKLFNLEGIGEEQTDFSTFSKQFFSTRTTTADVSIDSNANVDGVDVISYSKELPKPIFKLNSYYVLHKKCKQLYGLQKANQIVEDALTGALYINDFHGVGGGLSYCFNFSLYDIVLQGLPMIKKIKSVPPKGLYSFKSQAEQFTIIAANSTLGATGLADFMLCTSLFIDKIFRTGNDIHIAFPGWFTPEEEQQKLDGIEVNRTEPSNKKVFENAVWTYVKENITSFIYTINQPLRGNQSCFTNVSIYSDTFLDQMVDGYVLDGYVVNKETVKKLQKLYLEIMNDEMKRTPVTFPVTTGCFVVDDNGNIPPEDEEFLDMISEQNLKYGFINIYCGKSSTLSSCCFRGDELIKVDDTFMKMSDFVHMYLNNVGELKIDKKHKISSVNFDSGKLEECYITGVLIKENEYKELIRITIGNSVISVTPDHVFKVKRVSDSKLVEVNAKELFNNKDLYLIPVIDDKLEYVIFEVESVKCEGNVYDIELEKNHYFAANNIISHNCRLRSDTENRFFNEEKFYDLTLEDGSIKKISSKETINVKNLTTGNIESVYLDEIKDNLNNYELV